MVVARVGVRCGVLGDVGVLSRPLRGEHAGARVLLCVLIKASVPRPTARTEFLDIDPLDVQAIVGILELASDSFECEDLFIEQRVGPGHIHHYLGVVLLVAEPISCHRVRVASAGRAVPTRGISVAEVGGGCDEGVRVAALVGQPRPELFGLFNPCSDVFDQPL